jgi:hypothetical protein
MANTENLGVYAPLFAAALWTSWQESTTASKAMRAVCTLMSVLLTSVGTLLLIMLPGFVW